MRFLSLWPRFAVTVGAVLLLFFAYGSVLTRGPFGINDDYQYLHRVHAGTFDPAHNEQTGMGRPLASWGFEAAYALCDGKVARLVWLRALGVVGIGLFAWTLFRTFRESGHSRNFAGTVAALVALSPACGVYAAWAAAFVSPFALTAALQGGRMMQRAGRWGGALVGGLLLVAACSVWQAAAPLALFPALANRWGSSMADGRKVTWRPWMVCAVAGMFYLTLCWVIAHLGSVSGARTERLALADDVPSKIRLLGDLLRSGVTSWARLQPGWREWTIGVVTTGLCVWALLAPDPERGRWAAVLRRAGLAVAMLLLSVLPLLVARENNAAFRSLPGLYLVVAFLGVSGLTRLLRGGPGWLGGGASLALVVASAGAARYHVWHGLVEPNVREYGGLRTQVRAQFPSGSPGRLVYLLPPPTLLAAGRLTPSWEYGLVSSSFWWVTRPFLLLLFEATSPGAPTAPELTILYREAGNPGVPVLDPLPVLLREPGTWREDPHWGQVRTYSRGWLYSPWFGYFNVEDFPIIQHHILGSLIYTSQAKDGKDLWFYHDRVGQIFVDPAKFPQLYLAASHCWVTLSDDNPANVTLDDLATRQRLPYPR